jgi:hypothetical protein
MTKTQGKSSIKISKLAFLDEMLPEPTISYHDEDLNWPILENADKLLELVKKLAAKVLTEEELVNILGDKSKNNMFGKSTYAPSSDILTDPFQ